MIRTFYLSTLFLLLLTPIFSQNRQELETNLTKAHSGESVYTLEQLITMYDNIATDDYIILALWGRISINILNLYITESSESIDTLHDLIKKAYKHSKKISFSKASSEELYHLGLLAYELFNYTMVTRTVLKVDKPIKTSWFDTFLQYKDFFNAVVQKDKAYVVEAEVLLASAFGYPSSAITSNWNSYVLSKTEESILQNLDPYLQFRGLLARAQVLLKQGVEVNGLEILSKAITIFPDGFVSMEAQMIEQQYVD